MANVTHVIACYVARNANLPFYEEQDMTKKRNTVRSGNDILNGILGSLGMVGDSNGD